MPLVAPSVRTRRASSSTAEQKALGFHIRSSPLSYSQAGEVITYTYTISNEGNVSLPGPFRVKIDGITDPIEPCGSGPLALGELTQCSSTYLVSQNDIGAGSLSPYYGRAQTDGATSAVFEAEVPEATGNLLLSTVATPPIYTALGEEIVYSYTIVNTSGVTLTAPFTVINDQLGSIPCSDADLGAGMSSQCQGVHVIVESDLTVGVITSNALARNSNAISPNTRSTVKVGSRTLALTVSATPQSYRAINDTITYQYTIKNGGAVSLAGPFTVVDDLIGTINACGNGLLAPGATTSCTATHTITGAEVSADSLHNNAHVYGNGATSPIVQLTLTKQGITNQTPTAFNDQATTKPGTAVLIDVQANDSDPDGDALTLRILSQPANGVAAVNNGQIAYTPKPGFTGTDSFTYQVSDGKGGSASATVTVIVTATPVINQQPTATNDQATTPAGVPVTINVQANDSDPDGDALTVTILTQPTNGTATVSNGQIVYTPAAGFAGTESFTYRISDGKGGAATATVTVTVVGSGTPSEQHIYLPVVQKN